MSAEGFLARLATVFGEPITDNPEQFVAEYRDALKAYAPSVLAEAAAEVIRNHAGPHRWPRLKACLEACERAAEREARAAATPEAPDRWTRGQAIAARVITPPMAKQAWTQGWFAGLWDFVVQTHRLPEAGEVPRIRARSFDNGRIMRETVENPGEIGPMGPVLAKLGRSMLAGYERRYRRITGDAA